VGNREIRAVEESLERVRIEGAPGPESWIRHRLHERRRVPIGFHWNLSRYWRMACRLGRLPGGVFGVPIRGSQTKNKPRRLISKQTTCGFLFGL
jgi:hypothetical protein